MKNIIKSDLVYLSNTSIMYQGTAIYSYNGSYSFNEFTSQVVSYPTIKNENITIKEKDKVLQIKNTQQPTKRYLSF